MRKINDEKLWFLWGSNTRRLITWTHALTSNAHYEVRLDTEATEIAYTCSAPPEIVVNPLWNKRGSPADQMMLTKALLAHEVGHVLFTDTWNPTTVAEKEMLNVLEDERSERLTSKRYPGITPLFTLLATYSLRNSRGPIQATMPHDLANACLRYRWQYHLPAFTLFRSITPEMEVLWGQVKPLVEASWVAPNTDAALGYARQILALLNISSLSITNLLRDIYDGMRALDPDNRDGDDSIGIGITAPTRPQGKTDAKDYSYQFKPASYVALQDACQVAARQLGDNLTITVPRQINRAHEWNGRYSPRLDMRTPDTAFQQKAIPKEMTMPISVSMLLDCSTSMFGMMDDLRKVAMTTYLALHHAGIPLYMRAFSGDNTSNPYDDCGLDLARHDDEEAEISKALIAGLKSGGTTCVSYSVDHVANEIKGRRERLPICFVVHDGEPCYDGPEGDDRFRTPRSIQALEKAGVRVVGIYLGNNQTDFHQMRRYFPNQSYMTTSQKLPELMETLLRGFCQSVRLAAD